MGLGDLFLVEPHAPITVETRQMASGACDRLDAVRSFANLDSAIAGAVKVYGLSARRRERRASPIWVEDIVPEALAASRTGPVVFLFGTERTGLENDELDRAHRIVRIPTSTEFKSLNIAQAVMIVGYELRRSIGAELGEIASEPATANDIALCVEALAAALDRRGFFIPKKRTYALRRIRDLLGRGSPEKSEISLLRGMIRSLDEDFPAPDRPAQPVPGLDGDS